MAGAELNSALSISQKTLVFRHFSLGRAQEFSLPGHDSKKKSASFLKQRNNGKKLHFSHLFPETH